MTILVTGGAGYIGSHVVRLLQQQGKRVTVIDNLSSGNQARIGESRLVELDLASADAKQTLVDIIREDAVTAVIHFAARKQVGESVLKPEWYFEQNIGGMANMLEAMHECGVSQLVFSSSAATYGMPDVPAVTEDDRFFAGGQLGKNNWNKIHHSGIGKICPACTGNIEIAKIHST